MSSFAVSHISTHTATAIAIVLMTLIIVTVIVIVIVINLVICTIIFSNPKIKSNITVIEASPP